MNVVWLASWYPNRTDITNGDFIERHAKAVAPFVNSLTVITAVKDEALAYNAVEIVEEKKGNLTTFVIYYGRTKWGGGIERFLSLKKYISLHLDLFDKLIQEQGKPAVVHVHVAMKAGMVARKIRQQYNIPYIITEHWTAYYKEARPNIFSMGNYFTGRVKSVIKNAALLITVSDELGKMINKNLIPTKYRVIPNVVDTTLFSPTPKKNSDVTRLVHISNMGYQKNAVSIMKALAIWKQQGGRFTMQVFGEATQEVTDLVGKSNLDKDVIFNGEVLQPELCNAVKEADGLVLYSHYETFGCVIIEANASGIPVILSDLPVFHELVTENENGIFVEPDNPVALAGALTIFSQTKNNFDQDKIAAKAKARFAYEVVGRQIVEAYHQLIEG